MSDPEVAILIGLQGSGKTTFYRQVLAATHVHVSKDNFPKARQRQQRQLRMVRDALSEGRDVAVDNTNPSAEEWRPLIDVARANGARAVAYWFPPDLADSLERNAVRAGKSRVPEVGIYATLKRLRRPQLTDRFDEIFVVGFDGDGGFTIERQT
jgi:predicted kinase